MLSENKIRLTV